MQFRLDNFPKKIQKQFSEGAFTLDSQSQLYSSVTCNFFKVSKYMYIIGSYIRINSKIKQTQAILINFKISSTVTIQSEFGVRYQVMIILKT